MKQHILLGNRLIPYTLTRKKVKNINLRIKGGEIFISASNAVPLSTIEDLMKRKAAWILSVLEQEQGSQPCLADGYVCLCGKQVPLPEDMNRAQWQKQQAAELLPVIFEEAWLLFQNDGFQKPALRLHKMKSRWGSCIPSKGIITLNTALVGADRRCQLAVAAHELCHMLHPNHSKAFYAELLQRVPDYMQCRQTLKSAQSFLIDL